MITIVGVSLALLLVLGSILALFNWRVWIVYGLRAQKFQLGILLSLMLVSFPFYKTEISWLDYSMVLLMISTVIVNFYGIFPFTPFAKKELSSTKDDTNAFSFLTANVRMSNEKDEVLLEQIKTYQSDAILLTEVNNRWIQSVAVLKNDYPYTCIQAQENTYGMALYSKYPLEDTQVEFLVDPDVPSIHCKFRFREGQLIQFLGLHPRPPAPWTKEENKDIELIVAAVRTNENLYPSIVSGDLNDVAWSPATQQFKMLSGLIDPRVG